MPHGVLSRPRGNLQRVQPFANLACGQLFCAQPAQQVPHHIGLCGMDFDPWQQPGLFGDRALALHPRGPGEQCRLARFVQPAAPCPVRNLTALVFGDHPLHLG